MIIVPLIVMSQVAEPGALATADRFLSAWQNRDADRGIALASRRLKAKRGVKDLRQWIVGLSNPHNLAFEVGKPTVLPGAKASVPVRLYYEVTGRKDRGRPKLEHIILVKSGGKWLVDDLR